MSQNESKNRVMVSIYGEEYTMRSPSSGEYMRRIAHYVDERMKQVGQSNNRLGTNKIAVLTAINLADELFQVRRELRELEKSINKKNGGK